MANRRCISKDIFTDDKFTDLSAKTRLLYVYLILNSDDEGFLSNIKQALFLAGATKTDLKKLTDIGYIRQFTSGVVCIMHWYQFNNIQPSKRNQTIFIDEFAEMVSTDNIYNSCRKKAGKKSEQSNQNQLNQNEQKESKINFDDNECRIKTPTENGNGKTKIPNEKMTNILTAFSQDEECKKVKDYYFEKIGVIKKIEDVILLKELIEIYGAEIVMHCIDITAANGGEHVQYLARVCESENEGA